MVEIDPASGSPKAAIVIAPSGAASATTARPAFVTSTLVACDPKLMAVDSGLKNATE